MIDNNLQEDYALHFASEILSVKGIGEKIGSIIVNEFTDLYGLGYIEKETISKIYSEVMEDGSKYDTFTEALEAMDLLNTDTLYSTDFNVDTLIEGMLSTYRWGSQKTMDEVSALGLFDKNLYDEVLFKKELDKTYRDLEDTCEFASLIEVYNNHGLLAAPILPDKTYADVTETTPVDVMETLMPQTTTMHTENPMIPIPTESHIDSVSAQEQGNGRPVVGIFGVVFLGNVYEAPVVDTAEVR